jgi:hypothetical protein
MMMAGTGDQREARPRPTVKSMNERGSQLLEAHIRSFDPGEPTARERLMEALGESLARKLVFALRLSH